MARSYTATRERELAPVLQAMRQQDYAGALTLIRPILKTYPKDVRVLFLAGNAARISGDLPDALTLYQQSIDNNPSHAGALHLGLVQTYADMGRWEDFNRERALIRQMSLNGDQSLPIDRGYPIEDHHAGSLHIEVIEFPAFDSLTRYRFLFVSNYQKATRFTPSVDVEANPIDKASFTKEYPQKPANIRFFSLVSYPDNHTRGFLKFYSDGEPPYEDVHADVMAIALKSTSTTVPAPSTQQFRPAYKPPPPNS
jgi:tetratricopeptide (TPR) repeat protein